MDLLTALKTRRSVRNYSEENIPLSLIEEIAEYGLYAPSAHNQQAWKLYLISNPQDRNFLGELMEYGKMIPQAGRVILAGFDEKKLRSPEFIQQDMGACIQNILLATHAKGLGAVWIGLYPHEKEIEQIRQHFRCEENIVPFALIAIGK